MIGLWLGLWLGLRVRVKVMVRVRVGFMVMVRVGVGVRIRVNLTLTLTKTLELNLNLLSYWECCRNMVRKKKSAARPGPWAAGRLGPRAEARPVQDPSTRIIYDFAPTCSVTESDFAYVHDDSFSP